MEQVDIADQVLRQHRPMSMGLLDLEKHGLTHDRLLECVLDAMRIQEGLQREVPVGEDVVNAFHPDELQAELLQSFINADRRDEAVQRDVTDDLELSHAQALGFGILRPIPIIQSHNEIMVGASFRAVHERLNAERLKDLKGLKYSRHHCLCQQACNDLAI